MPAVLIVTCNTILFSVPEQTYVHFKLSYEVQLTQLSERYFQLSTVLLLNTDFLIFSLLNS